MRSAAGDATERSETIRRIFVVGCPRSGTTLVQTLLASHPCLVTLPETHFFSVLTEGVGRLRWLGLASREARRKLRAAAEHLGGEAPELGVAGWMRRRLVREFVSLLDAHAVREGASGWVEKTPRHLRRIQMVQEHLPDALFCHVLRRGPKVVASLYKVTADNPAAWGGERSLSRCVDRWLDDVETSLSFRGRAGHAHVRYADVVQDPEDALESLWRTFGLSPEPLTEEAFREAREAAEPADAPWQSVGEAVEASRGSRIRELLTPRQRAQVKEHLLREGSARGLYWEGEPLFE